MPIHIFRTDNAKDYFSTYLRDYLLNQGIVHQSSCVDTPKQNKVAERKNRHVLGATRSLLFTTHVPKHFWGEAILTSTYLINRMPSWVLGYKTPCQIHLDFFPYSRLISTIPLKIFLCPY